LPILQTRHEKAQKLGTGLNSRKGSNAPSVLISGPGKATGGEGLKVIVSLVVSVIVTTKSNITRVNN